MVEQSVHVCELSTYVLYYECIHQADDDYAAYTMIIL